MFAGQNMLIGGGDLSGPRKRVAVIGCGAAGLVGMKTVLEYGHSVVGFERLSDIGGLWNFKVNALFVYFFKRIVITFLAVEKKNHDMFIDLWLYIA